VATPVQAFASGCSAHRWVGRNRYLVTDMNEVLEEAYELVEHELITPDDFREFVFTNAARLHTALNPDFFKGTVVEDAVAPLVLQASPVEEAAATGDN
jgi:hypothetical protein